MNKLKTLAAAALLLGGGVSTSALAQEASYSAADQNRDGYVSGRERADHQARLGPPAYIVVGPTPVIVVQERHEPPFARDAEGKPAESPNPHPSEIGG